MSRFFVLIRPALVPGFHLAGVEAFGAPDGESAARLLREWLDEGETGLIAVDDGLLESVGAALRRRLRASDRLLIIPIPGGKPFESAGERRERLTRLVHQAIGTQITFGGEADEQTPSS